MRPILFTSTTKPADQCACPPAATPPPAPIVACTNEASKAADAERQKVIAQHLEQPVVKGDAELAADTLRARQCAAGMDPRAARRRPAAKPAPERIEYKPAQSDEDVRLGFQGPKIAEKQRMLKELGYDLGTSGENGDGVDGKWGPKTEAAYQEHVAKQRDAQDLSGDLTKRDDWTRPRPKIDRINERLLDLDNASMAKLNAEVKAETGKTLRKSIDNMDRAWTGARDATAIRGDNSDYKDFMRRVAGGKRNEGEHARADNKVVDEYARQLIAAREERGMSWMPSWGNGTDEKTINHVFATASPEQLKELDRRFRAGVTDDHGKVVKYTAGLQGYLDAELGGFGWGSAHKEALEQRIARALQRA